METRYVQKYYNDDKKPIKIVCLGFCILLDLISIAGIIACFSTEKYLDLIAYAVVLSLALLIRISTLFFTYQIIIEFDEGIVTILKKYPLKDVLLFKGQALQLKIQKYNSQDIENDKKCVRLCPKSCEYGVYVLELSKRKYLIYLDDYLFSLIEVNSDLS